MARFIGWYAPSFPEVPNPWEAARRAKGREKTARYAGGALEAGAVTGTLICRGRRLRMTSACVS
jgi:hypothetical protein